MTEVVVTEVVNTVVVDGEATVAVIVEQAVSIVDVAQQGPAGAQGIQGPAGASNATYTAGGSVSGHQAVTLDSTSTLIYADAATPAHAWAVLGVSLNAAASGGAVEVARSGPVDHSGWAFTPGSPVFLGLAGALVQAVPLTAAFVKVMGVAVSPTRVVLDPQPAIYL